MMQELKQLVRDASLTTQDAWKLVARRKRLTPQLQWAVVIKLATAQRFIDEALEELGAGAEARG